MYAEKIYSAAFTDDGLADEACVAKEFDEVLASLANWFRVASEVTGWYVSQRSRVKAGRPRIDRILMPTKAMQDEGWDIGPIGVELKREGGKKIGPPVCQAIDYTHAVFPVGNGSTCMLEWVFVYPLREVAGDIASIMLQNRVGWACSHLGVLYLKTDRTIRIEPSAVDWKKPQSGYKRGSR